MDIYQINEKLVRAEYFIAQGGYSDLQHACLELRLAIERIVYRKLSQLGDSLPPEIYRTWQAPKAMKLLLGFEPRADKPAKLEICLHAVGGEENNEWLDLGEYRMLSLKWLNKNYNKLGKFLHETSLEESSAPKKLRSDDLISMVVELRRVNESDMVLGFNRISEIICDCCSTTIFVSNSQIEDCAEVSCYNDLCGAVFIVEPSGDEQFKSKRKYPGNVFSCKDCGSKVSVDSVMKDGYIKCWSCKQRYLISWAKVNVAYAPESGATGS